MGTEKARRPDTAAAAVLRLFEGDLQDATAESESVQRGDRRQRLVVVGHRDEAETLAFVRGKVAHHLDVLHGAERPEQLPENVLFRFRCQVVYEQTPAAAAARRHQVTARQRQGAI